MDIIDLSDGSDPEKLNDKPGEIRGDEHELQQVDERLEEVSVKFYTHQCTVRGLFGMALHQ